MQEMLVYGVSLDLAGKQPMVLLKTAEGNRLLPISIGHPEAAAILVTLQGEAPPRPLTHDLVGDILGELDAHLLRIAVTELRDDVFYAQITLAVQGGELEIDSRPSDAIALAVRADAPIYAAETVLEQSAIELDDDTDVEEEQIVEEFKRFLEDTDPGDFSQEP